MPTVRAKFHCHTKSEQRSPGQGSKIVTAELNAVSSSSPENAVFFQATPSGQVKLSCMNLEAGSAFESGKEYYIDFIPVEEEEKRKTEAAAAGG